jgi:hypothetical protein
MKNNLWFVVVIILIGCIVRQVYLNWLQKLMNVNWIETTAEILDSEFSIHTHGNEYAYTKGETTRKVKLTVKIPLEDKSSVIVTRKVWTKTKNRSIFYKGEYVTILYDQNNPKNFKLKYDI